MTEPLFGLVLLVLIGGGFLSMTLVNWRPLGDRVGPLDRVEPGSASTIAVMFSLFLAFSMSEITQRSRDLGLAVQKEVSVARSIFKFAESVGASAGPVRQSLVEYLQAVVALEPQWLEHPMEPESPAQATADTMVQVVTLFVVQSPASPAVKSLIIAKVDELRQARTERITLSRRSSGIPQWIIQTLIALATQFIIAAAYIGKPWAQRLVEVCFTVSAVAAMCYLAWIDGLIGPSRIAASILPLSDVLATMAY